MRLFVDTGAWIALADRSDQYHTQAASVVRHLSVADALMKRLHLERVFAFDEDFRKLGYRLVP